MTLPQDSIRTTTPQDHAPRPHQATGLHTMRTPAQPQPHRRHATPFMAATLHAAPRTHATPAALDAAPHTHATPAAPHTHATPAPLHAAPRTHATPATLQELEVLVGLDVDPLAHQIAGARLTALARPGVKMHWVRANYRCLGYGVWGLGFCFLAG